jgi:hypothetical protein
LPGVQFYLEIKHAFGIFAGKQHDPPGAKHQDRRPDAYEEQYNSMGNADVEETEKGSQQQLPPRVTFLVLNC